MENISQSRYRFYTMRAWFVHLYTSLGVVLAFYAILAVIHGNITQVITFLAIACVIDGTDGTLARLWNVKKWAASFDGRKLDDIVDYLNYAFIPILCCYRFNLITENFLPLLAFVLIAAIYGFCNNSAKTDDGFFTGFPNYWNFLVVYIFLFRFSPLINAFILLVFALLIWVPIKYISLSTVPFRPLTIVLSLAYSILMIPVLLHFSNPDMRLVFISLIGPVYYFIISIYLTLKGQHTFQTAG